MTELRIYFEDTDAGGIVYYANYLRFIERARSDYLRERGLTVRELQERGYHIPVIHLEIDYLSPAVLEDLIRIDTAVLEITHATFTLSQKVVRVSDGRLLADSTVTLACIGPGNKARRLPKELLDVIRTDAQ